MSDFQALELYPAPLPRRIVAAIVDVACLSVLTLALLSYFFGRQYLNLEYLELLPDRLSFLVWLVLLPTGVMFVWWLIWQSSPGKALFSLSIVDRDSGHKPRFSQLVRRLIGYLICLASLGLGFLLVLFTPDRGGFHDRLAGTMVIGEAPETGDSPVAGGEPWWLPFVTAGLGMAIAAIVFYSPIGSGDGGGVIGYSIYRGLLLLFVQLPLLVSGLVIAVAIGLADHRKHALAGLAANGLALAAVLFLNYLAG